MAHAYTPGLRVSARTTLRKTRRLPLSGELAVRAGDRVVRDQVVARTELPGDAVTQNLVNRLGVPAADLPRYMLKQEGDPVREGEPLAETRPWIKWFKTVVPAETGGIVESISTVTGQVLLRKPPSSVEIPAFVDGVVVEELPGEGVVVETQGAYVQGIFGVGGERWGPLRVLSRAHDEPLSEGQIDDGCGGAVLVAGGIAGIEALERAAAAGAAGVIAGGIHDRDLKELLGYDLGVAITGAEEIGATLIVTEGFGEIAMARNTFDILRSCDGKQASISGATQIRAGVQRPEIIVPSPRPGPAQATAPKENPGRPGRGGRPARHPRPSLRARRPGARPHPGAARGRKRRPGAGARGRVRRRDPGGGAARQRRADRTVRSEERGGGWRDSPSWTG